MMNRLKPWCYRQGSFEKRNAWKSISNTLKAMQQALLKVSERATRDKLNLLMKKIKRNDNEKKRISGIEVEEEDELDKGLQDIVELFDA